MRAALVVLATLSSAACASHREKRLAMIPEGALAPPERPAGSAPGARPRARRDGGDAKSATLASAPWADGPFVPAQGSPVAARSPSTTTVPAAAAGGGRIVSSSSPPAHQPLPAGVSVEQTLRETFLSCDTTVVAEKATLFVPARYAAEASLSGVSVVDAGPGRRTATAGALRLRRLSIRARTLSLVVRPDASEDVSITARGDVSFDADRPASVITERHLKSLIVHNDGYTPLR